MIRNLLAFSLALLLAACTHTPDGPSVVSASSPPGAMTTDATARLMTGEAWADYCDRIKVPEGAE